MRAEITDLQKWKRAHNHPIEKWLYAFEEVTRANIDFTLRIVFIWPRIFLRIGA